MKSFLIYEFQIVFQAVNIPLSLCRCGSVCTYMYVVVCWLVCLYILYNIPVYIFYMYNTTLLYTDSILYVYTFIFIYYIHTVHVCTYVHVYSYIRITNLKKVMYDIVYVHIRHIRTYIYVQCILCIRMYKNYICTKLYIINI